MELDRCTASFPFEGYPTIRMAVCVSMSEVNPGPTDGTFHGARRIPQSGVLYLQAYLDSGDLGFETCHRIT